MLITYLAQYRNRDLINDLTTTDIKRLMHDNIDLCDFIKKDMQQYRHATEIVIQRDICRNSDEEFLKLLQQYKLAYDARVIIYTPDALDKNLQLVRGLIDIEIYDVVTASDYEKVREQFSVCLNGGMRVENWYDIFPELKPQIPEVIPQEPVQQTDAEKKARLTRYVRSAQNVSVCFAGVQPRVGTTKLAVDLAQYLQSLGASVAFIDPGITFVDALTDNFACDIVGGSIARFKEIEFTNEIPKNRSYNFIIQDMGVPAEKPMHSDLTVLCSTFSFFEKEICRQKIVTINPDIVFANMVHPNEYHRLADEFDKCIVLFPDYAPGFFMEQSVQENSLTFDALLTLQMERDEKTQESEYEEAEA